MLGDALSARQLVKNPDIVMESLHLLTQQTGVLSLPWACGPPIGMKVHC
jgi:hypothetical protein